jgi:hypothetical protein
VVAAAAQRLDAAIGTSAAQCQQDRQNDEPNPPRGHAWRRLSPAMADGPGRGTERRQNSVAIERGTFQSFRRRICAPNIDVEELDAKRRAQLKWFVSEFSLCEFWRIVVVLRFRVIVFRCLCLAHWPVVDAKLQ